MSASAEKVKRTVAGGKLEDESVYRAREREELEALIDEDVEKDTGASVSGLHHLVCELFFPISTQDSSASVLAYKSKSL